MIVAGGPGSSSDPGSRSNEAQPNCGIARTGAFAASRHQAALPW
jgi:hypothetical protein